MKCNLFRHSKKLKLKIHSSKWCEVWSLT